MIKLSKWFVFATFLLQMKKFHRIFFSAAQTKRDKELFLHGKNMINLCNLLFLQ